MPLGLGVNHGTERPILPFLWILQYAFAHANALVPQSSLHRSVEKTGHLELFQELDDAWTIWMIFNSTVPVVLVGESH